MRRMALLAALCLLAGACGDDAATTTSAPITTTATTTSTTEPPSSTTTSPTSSSTTTEPETTTTATTYAWTTFEVPEADLCVVENRSGETLNVRAGPGTAYDVVGTLSFDQTGVHATGLGASDDQDRVWKEIDYFGGSAWVASWLLTPDACALEAPADFCVVDTSCTGRLNVRSGPASSYQKMGSLPYDSIGLQATGASSADPDGRLWRQIRFRGNVGWVASWFLSAAPCTPSAGEPCDLPSGGPTAGCVDGWTTPRPGSASWNDALEQIGVGGPWSEIDPGGFVVEEMHYCTGPEDADIIDPRPTVERWYIVGYAETDPDYQGRWLVRRTEVGFGLAAVAPYDSTGFGSGVWETCVDTCRTGRPLAGQLCDATCVEDYVALPCEGIVPGTWSPGDCSGPPPEVLACFG